MKAFVHIVANSLKLPSRAFRNLGRLFVFVVLCIPNYAFAMNSSIDTIGIVAQEGVPFFDCLGAGNAGKLREHKYLV